LYRLQAQPYRTILTHFSTRYPKMPAADLGAYPSVGVAMDFMTVNLADLPWLPRIVPALAALFNAEESAWEQEDTEKAPEKAAGTAHGGGTGGVQAGQQQVTAGGSKAQAQGAQGQKQKQQQQAKGQPGAAVKQAAGGTVSVMQS
jgi:hypothetical protein